MSAFEWPIIMRAGMRGLGLKPEEFWALTPAELALLLGEDTGRLPMDRTGLEALAAQFPDEPKDGSNE